MTALAILCERFGWRLLRDAPVASFGFIDIPLNDRLVFAVDQQRITAAAGVAAVLVPHDLAEQVPDRVPGVATTADPLRAALEAHNHLVEEGVFYGPWLPTVVDSTARVHPRAVVADFGVVISAGCRIAAGAVIGEGVVLGPGVTVMPNAVLGAEGFQRIILDGHVHRFAHGGSVIVASDVTVMAGAVVARAVFRQATTLGQGCIIGNGAFVSHNVQIGERSLVGHGAVVCGNTQIGNDVTIGPSATLVDRITVGEGATVTAGALVIRPVNPGGRVSGRFAMEHRVDPRSVAGYEKYFP
jgi:UDP-3-O-[3-hydroxymyristoyl] glucosamine N-acyltransferase